MSFAIYKSSAGSGKTFTLVKEYLKIVLQDPDKFRHILAVTFTNKAANEMKIRIIKTLRSLSAGAGTARPDNGPMLDALMHETGLSGTLIAGRASLVLRNILHHYSEFAIGTIDSFMYRVIRTFAYDLKIPLNFEVELDTQQFLKQAVDVLISQVGHDEDLTRVLIRFVEAKTELEGSWKIDKDLQEFAKIMIQDESYPFLKKLRDLEIKDLVRVDKRLHQRVVDFENKLAGLASEILALVHKQGLSADSFIYKNKGIYPYLERLSDRNFAQILPGSNVVKASSSGNWINKSAPADEKVALESIQSKLNELYNRIQQLIRDRYNDYILFRRLRRHIYPIAVLSEIEKVIDGFRESENLIHISEFNRRISGIVSREPVPFIYERLGERYHHYLVDEFQDTSFLQWYNLVPLFENALGHGHFSMVVGDVKQAIYRWRGGDAEQISRLPRIVGADKDPILKEREISLVRNALENNLLKNFRSLQGIVRFNNDFFDCISKILPEGIKESFVNVIQEWLPEKEGGYIQFDLIPKDITNTYEEETFSFLDHHLEELIQDGYGFQDIAILCRSNKQASLIARHLLNHEINVVSSESLLLCASQKVSFLVSCIRLLSDPRNNIAVTEMTGFLVSSGRIPAGDLNEVLVALTRRRANSDENKPAFILEQLMGLMDQHQMHFRMQYLSGIPLYELVEELIRLFDLNQEFDPYLQFFLDCVHDYVRKKTAGLGGFLEWWEENYQNQSIIVSEGQEAIQVMTIHKAKGLEFPVVIYPFADDGFTKPQKNNVWVEIEHKEIRELKVAPLEMSNQLLDTDFEKVYRQEMDATFMDAINLLYVAMTRPTDRFYALSRLPAEPKDGKYSNITQLFVHYLKSKGLWQADMLSYSFGSREMKKENENKKITDVFILGSLISESWRDRLLIRSRALETWNLESPEKSREWGNLVHYLLSKINYHEDIETVMEHARIQGLINSDGIDQLRSGFRSLMGHPNLFEYYTDQWEIRNEAEILYRGKTYRPDRVLLRDNEVVILDYKTGRKEEQHHMQINHYSRLLKEMSYQVVAKYLVYIGEEVEIVEV